MLFRNTSLLVGLCVIACGKAETPVEKSPPPKNPDVGRILTWDSAIVVPELRSVGAKATCDHLKPLFEGVHRDIVDNDIDLKFDCFSFVVDYQADGCGNNFAKVYQVYSPVGTPELKRASFLYYRFFDLGSGCGVIPGDFYMTVDARLNIDSKSLEEFETSFEDALNAMLLADDHDRLIAGLSEKEFSEVVFHAFKRQVEPEQGVELAPGDDCRFSASLEKDADYPNRGVVRRLEMKQRCLTRSIPGALGCEDSDCIRGKAAEGKVWWELVADSLVIWTRDENESVKFFVKTFVPEEVARVVEQ